jgi:uncharacterized protein with LGFP repeats
VLGRRVLLAVVTALLVAPAVPAQANAAHLITRVLPFTADHVAVYWKGNPDAVVRVAFSRDGVKFGRAVDAGRDDIGAQRHNGITYGAVLRGRAVTAVRIVSDRPLPLATAVALPGRPIQRVIDKVLPPAAPTPDNKFPRPAIVSRAEWGADESLRFSNGKESWTPTFYPVQKLIVHHTDTGNRDPNPASTVRAIYHYHAITQGWGDIGYNFLIDEAGRIYKGRNSHAPGSDADTINGQNANGYGVTGAHARNFNAGAVGVALLGTLTSQDATPQAKRALEDLLAWEADAHGIDPRGSSTYTSPIDGRQKTFANIAGHRDVGQTQCPGGAFYATLPTVRDATAARLAAR